MRVFGLTVGKLFTITHFEKQSAFWIPIAKGLLCIFFVFIVQVKIEQFSLTYCTTDHLGIRANTEVACIECPTFWNCHDGAKQCLIGEEYIAGYCLLRDPTALKGIVRKAILEILIERKGDYLKSMANTPRLSHSQITDLLSSKLDTSASRLALDISEVKTELINEKIISCSSDECQYIRPSVHPFTFLSSTILQRPLPKDPVLHALHGVSNPFGIAFLLLILIILYRCNAYFSYENRVLSLRSEAIYVIQGYEQISAAHLHEILSVTRECDEKTWNRVAALLSRSPSIESVHRHGQRYYLSKDARPMIIQTHVS
eukprot:TRINITY_DN3567_c0_g3_i4.p1 TRINITY_DN3567_c0_g3~~TRINITY_DN3567_c0_g3_i4.p1  ORF type:complete len:315 (+),score=42.91 TRINITY_DN3567_c0_g3_i4:62-1006(+)